MAHQPLVCNKVGNTGQYSTKNWSFVFKCIDCGRTGRFNQNFLGQRLVVCDGDKFTKVKDAYAVLKAFGVSFGGPAVAS